MTGFTDEVGFIWSVADLLRGADDDLREVAAVDFEENFADEFDRWFAEVLENRHSLYDELFRMFFDKPEFADTLTTWARQEVYHRIRKAL